MQQALVAQSIVMGWSNGGCNRCCVIAFVCCASFDCSSYSISQKCHGACARFLQQMAPATQIQCDDRAFPGAKGQPTEAECECMRISWLPVKRNALALSGWRRGRGRGRLCAAVCAVHEMCLCTVNCMSMSSDYRAVKLSAHLLLLN